LGETPTWGETATLHFKSAIRLKSDPSFYLNLGTYATETLWKYFYMMTTRGLKRHFSHFKNISITKSSQIRRYAIKFVPYQLQHPK